MDNITIKVTTAAIRFSAMNLLAMREHSVLELEQKLEQKFGNAAVSENEENIDCFKHIVKVIEKLTAEGLQSDSRFTEAFIAMRQRQGKGPLLIRMELKERGINNDIIAARMNASDEIWNQIATKVYIKKFGNQTEFDSKQRFKQMRFLTARGFSVMNIQSALKCIDPTED